MVNLADVARESDAAVANARRSLVEAVRAASRAGMTQQEIARQIGRSQPEVSRLLRFHGTSPLAMRLRRHRAEVIAAVEATGGSNVRVFGSVATGSDHRGSDIDLLFTPGPGLDLMELERLEQVLRAIVGADVDLVPDTSILPILRDRIHGEAMPL
ncbi:nucleotidyltransferase family protein [Mariniluteicoccus flavus]